MTALTHRKRRRPDMRRVVILFPSGFTLGNLFFGVFAIIAASRLEFVAAGVYVLLGGICDAFDGRVARATNAGTEFGEELDSLVDAITFGLAPGMIMYFAVLSRSGWDWIWVFLFAASAVLRLARFNIEQAGTAKTYFQGLPSPAAGITLASYYWFSQSSLYTYGAIADLKWHVLLRYLMVVLSFLMISNVPYPVFPRTGFRSLRSIGATVLLIGSMVLLLTRRLEYFFPIALIYVAWGPIRWVFSGLFERRQPTIPYDLSEGEDDEEEDDDDVDLDSQVHATRRSHRGDRAARTDLEERGERPERTKRGEREDQPRSRGERPSPRSSGADRVPDRTVRAERGERSERGERPERATRTRDTERPKREGRPKERPRRGERTAREPQADIAAGSTSTSESATSSGVDAITLGQPESPESASVTSAPVATPVDAFAPDAAALPAEGATAPRKRKRRRRRGERKDRDGSERTDAEQSESAYRNDTIDANDANVANDPNDATQQSHTAAAIPEPPSPAPTSAPSEPQLLLPRPSPESTE